MTNTIHHRGPNDSGCLFFEYKDAQVGLGHRRLSILDLSSHGHQPMQFEALTIVYNGEVYNFKEIREELQKENYTFESDSDTEVILKAYHKWGIKAVDRFNGMFAIAIYDKEQQTITLIRDRSGTKPLYYYFKDGLFLFGSELKSFHKCPDFDKEKEIDFNALAQYFHYGYIPQPYSIFKHTYKLKSGHYLTFTIQQSEPKVTKYWDVKNFYNLPKKNITYDNAKEELEVLLTSAFQYRTVSDVPVGIFLSGGYDSSAVAAILQAHTNKQIKTFSIGFHEARYDEAPYAKKVASYIGTNHTEYYCTKNDALEILPTLPDVYDEPFGDSSAIPTILVSKLAKEHVTVALSADAGDEIFGGYGKYRTTLQYYKFFSQIPAFTKRPLHYLFNTVDPLKLPILKNHYNISSKFKKIAEILDMTTDAVSIMKITSHIFTPFENQNIIQGNYTEYHTDFDTLSQLNPNNDILSNLLAIDYQTYLPDDILTKVDRATMSVSLEGREPLLDHRIIEYVSQLPSGYKMNQHQTKIILKDIVHKYLPKTLMDRPKKGFSIPISEWFRSDLKTYLLYYLTTTKLETAGLRSHEIIRIRDEYLNGTEVNIGKLWSILMYLMWYERWM